jgi:heme/copper-type cytochrome/quinol oxidase subunit 2
VEKPVDWLVVTLVVLLTNLVAVGLGAAGYFLWKRRARRRAASEPVDEEDDDDQ